MDRYSAAGAEIAPSYSDQADYIARIPNLLDEAQMYIATTVRRIKVTVPLKELAGEMRGSWTVYTLPEDCCRVTGTALVALDDGGMLRCGNYHLLDGSHMAVHRSVADDVWLEYERKPNFLGEKPADDAELDNAQEVQMALPYYAAAHLVMYDNAYAYQALMNEFETRLARLAESPTIIYGTVADTYGAAEDWGGY